MTERVITEWGTITAWNGVLRDGRGGEVISATEVADWWTAQIGSGLGTVIVIDDEGEGIVGRGLRTYSYGDTCQPRDIAHLQATVVWPGWSPWTAKRVKAVFRDLGPSGKELARAAADLQLGIDNSYAQRAMEDLEYQASEVYDTEGLDAMYAFYAEVKQLTPPYGYQSPDVKCAIRSDGAVIVRHRDPIARDCPAPYTPYDPLEPAASQIAKALAKAKSQKSNNGLGQSEGERLDSDSVSSAQEGGV